MNSKKHLSQGFTIIEMTIALAFMAMLLIAIMTLTISAGKMYVKGVTNKQVNQSVRDIQDIVRRDFLAADATAITNVVSTGNATIGTTGRICLGRISYVWNSARILNNQGNTQAANLTIKRSGTFVRFARVVDPGGALCATPGNVVSAADINYTELLGGSTGQDFAIHALTMTNWGKNTDRGIYQLRLSLGTNEAGTTTGTECLPNSSNTANFDYCTVSSFDMMVRVGGK